MATMTVSYGTRMWVAELIRSGWTATVVRHSAMLHDGEVIAEGRIGVMVTDGTSGVFVPCGCEHDAIELLDAALEEAEE